MAKACTKIDTHSHTASLITVPLKQIYILYGTLNKLIRDIRTNTPWWFAVCCPLTCYLTENVAGMGEVGHDVKAFPGSSLCQFTQPVGGLWCQQITLWHSFYMVCEFRGTIMPLSCNRKTEQQQKYVQSLSHWVTIGQHPVGQAKSRPVAHQFMHLFQQTLHFTII